MNKNGFYIKKLEVLGDSVETADITFTKGLNVIYGDSDTGKTFIYQCIDYMLGDKKIPKVSINEAKGYTSCRLEIELLDNSQTSYILERNLKGGDIVLVGSKKILKANSQSKKETISDFLLAICNIENKKIRKNKQGATSNLYFGVLKRLFLIDEVKIITEDSPIVSGQYVAKTFDKNIFKFILSGVDDSQIVQLLSNEELIAKQIEIKLYSEVINDLKKEFPISVYNNIDNEIVKLDKEIESFQSLYSASFQEFKKHDDKKNKLYQNIVDCEFKVINLDEILKRSNILKKQYMSDILRLEASDEIGGLFSSLSISECPLCKHDVKHNDIFNYKEYFSATKNEVKKINLLLNELELSQKSFEEEKLELVQKVIKMKSEYDSLLQLIETEFNNKLEEILLKIKQFSDEREELTRIKVLKEKLDEYMIETDNIKELVSKYENQKNTNEDILKEDNMKKKIKYSELEETHFIALMKLMENILYSINFDKKSKISFSEKDLDFIIGEQKRGDFGKGYRAILYAVFIISMLEYLRTKPYQIGFTMIDSPLNPYKKDDKDDGDKLSDNLASNFYRYLAKNIKDEQVILIENTELPSDIRDEVNYREFRKGNGFLKGKL